MISTRLTLHIGFHKTGSTSVQAMLKQHEEYLLSHGICLPKAGRPRPDHMIHSNIGWEARGSSGFDPQFGTLEDLLDEVAGAGDLDQVVISDEGLSRLQEPEHFLQRLSAGDVKVLAYTRKLETLAPSLYCETLKFGKAQTFAEFVDDPPPILFHDEMTARWRNATPNFASFPIEDFPGSGDLPEHFFGELGVSLPARDDAARRANARMGQPEAFVLFAANNLVSLERDGLPVAEIKRYREACRKSARIDGGPDVPRFTLTKAEAAYGSEHLGLNVPMKFDASRASVDRRRWTGLVIDCFSKTFNRRPSNGSIRKLNKRIAAYLEVSAFFLWPRSPRVRRHS